MPFGNERGTTSSRRPRILVFACNNYNIARLPRALQKAGAEVAVQCDRNGPLAATRFSDWRFMLPPRTGRLRDARRTLHLAVALAILRPDIVIPGDERSLYV